MRQRHHRLSRRYEVRTSLNSFVSDYLEQVTHLSSLRDYFLNSELEIIEHFALPFLQGGFKDQMRHLWKSTFKHTWSCCKLLSSCKNFRAQKYLDFLKVIAKFKKLFYDTLSPCTLSVLKSEVLYCSLDYIKNDIRVMELGE